MKEKLFQIFFCIYIFWSVALSSFLGYRGIDVDGLVMRIALVVIALISWIFYLSYGSRFKNEKMMIGLLLFFGVYFYSTQYSHVQCVNYNGYIGQLLRWGSDCVSGCLIGMILTKLEDYSFIHKFLPWECIALTPFMAYATITLGSTQGQMHLDGGMNYQTVAYAMAELFAFSFFYSFIYNTEKDQFFLKKLIMMFAMLVQAACCAMSGGRGGLLLLVVYALYFCYYLIKNKIVSKQKLIKVGSLLTVSFFCLSDHLGVFQSSGFERSSNSLNDDDRFYVWAEYWKYLDDYPLFGYGPGGDYFTVGFYSHNMLIDFMLELGFLGTFIMIGVFFKTYKKVYALSMQDTIFVLVMILFIYGMVMNMFSGYWISKNVNWLAFGVAITSSNYYRIHSNS